MFTLTTSTMAASGSAQAYSFRNWFLYAPFIVFALLFPINFGGHLYLYPLVGISQNNGVLFSVSLIGAGLVIGIIGVFVNSQMQWYWRVLVAVFYVPAIIASLILSGM